MKECSKCLLKKKENEFSLRKNGTGKKILNSVCKSCLAEKQKEWRNKNKEHLSQYRKEHYEKNKPKYNANKEYKKNYNKENHVRLQNYRKEYYKNNKEKITQANKDNTKKRLKEDVIFRLKHNLRSNMNRSFKRIGRNKNSKTEQILGCSFADFKKYIESLWETWMNWENYGFYNGDYNFGWDIDHKTPISNAKNEEEVINLNHFSNLQPLCSKKNRELKKHKYT